MPWLFSVNLAELSTIANLNSPPVESELDPALVAESVSYLASDVALESLELDPYWPKWNSPWWQMLLLHELGMTKSIPQAAIEKVLEVMDKHYLKFFPFREEEIPPGKNPYRHIACHCALGSMEQVLHAWGIDVTKRLDWISPWYIKYQLPDGGLNCDEAAYTRTTPKGSIVSSIPPLEAVLHCRDGNLSADDELFLQRGAEYLIEKRLFRRSSDAKVIDEDWLKLCFPRFYHYDVLRGLNFLLDWSGVTRTELPISAIADAVFVINESAKNGALHVQRNAWLGANTLMYDPVHAGWLKKPSVSYTLLDRVSELGNVSYVLTNKWSDAKRKMQALIHEGLLL